MRKMTYFAVFMAAVAFMSACGNSYQETKRLSRLERQRLAKEDSAALKIAVMPTLDCLPIYVAADLRLFDTLGVDIRPKLYRAQMDCDEAMRAGRV